MSNGDESLCMSVKEQLTLWLLLDVSNSLKGGAGQRVGLSGCSCLGDLFPEGLGQAAL